MFHQCGRTTTLDIASIFPAQIAGTIARSHQLIKTLRKMRLPLILAGGRVSFGIKLFISEYLTNTSERQ